MNDYDIAFLQYNEELGYNKTSFDKDIEEFGWSYVSYYCKRWYEVQNNFSIKG